MPRIDTYDNFQVRQSAPSNNQVQAPNAPGDIGARQLGEAGQAVSRAGDVQSRILQAMQEDANQTRVNDAMNQYVQAQTAARVEAMQLRGRNALERPDGKSLPDEYGERMRARSQELAQGLGNDMQRKVFGQQAAHMDNQFRAALSEHMVAQQAIYRKETQKTGLDTAVNSGVLLYGDAAALAQSRATIERIVAAIAKDNGWSPEIQAAALAEPMSQLHTGVMKGMIQAGSASMAKAYYDHNSASMTLQARAQMQGIVKQASDAQAGESTADAVWDTTGPRALNDPVKLFDLERGVRDALKDNPDAMKHGIAALRERATAFNAQQAEVNNGAVNAVFGMIDKGMPMRQIQRGPEWLALPETKRHEIVRTLEGEAAAREARGAAAEARADARERRADHRLLLGNGDAYARVADPEVLGKMSREGVIATRTAFGYEGMQHLLARFEQLQKPGVIAEARMDKEDFQHVAEQMGLDPFNAKTPAKKQQLGELQFRVEQLIDAAQRAKGGALTRPEKNDLMRGELARTVTVNPGWFGFSRDVPVVQLSPEEAARVVVPQADKQAIGEALKAMYATDPANPAYAPTEANMRRLYLMKRSRAAALIPEAR